MKTAVDSGKRSQMVGVKSDFMGQYTVLWFTGMLTYMCFGLITPQLSVRIIDLGFSLGDFGLIQAVATLSVVATQVAIGKLSDHWGRRKPLVIAAVIMLFPSVLAFPHASSMFGLMVLSSTIQMSSAMFNATSVNWVSRFGKKGHMGRLHGFYRASFSLGWVIATLFIGTMRDHLGFEYTYYVAAAFLLVSATLVGFGTKERCSLDDPPTESGLTSVHSRYKLPRELKVLFFVFAFFTFAQTMSSHLNYIFLLHDIGVSNQQFGWISSIQSWPEVPLMLVLGVMSDRLSSVVLLAGGMVMGGIRWLLMSLVTGAMPMYFIQPLHSISMAISDVVVIAFITRLTPRERLGTALGWYVTMMNIARFLAPLAAGALGDYFGIRTVFTLSGVIAVLSGLVIAKVGSGSQTRA